MNLNFLCEWSNYYKKYDYFWQQVIEKIYFPNNSIVKWFNYVNVNIDIIKKPSG